LHVVTAVRYSAGRLARQRCPSRYSVLQGAL